MENLKYWVWLSKIEGLGSIRKQKLLKKYKSPKEIWNCKKEELLKIEGIGEKLAEEIVNNKYRINLEKEIKLMKQHGIDVISIYDNNYPYRLKQLYDMPISIYIKGNKKILNEKMLAIIGCRENSSYGEQVAKAVASTLTKRNIITISGLARGIDSISQRETIKQKGKTIAVIGSSIDIIYPYENKKLADEIINNGGAIISEYPWNIKPKKIHFPARNRIISGLSSGVIVIEAKRKSGTMTTVDFALEQGKNVFAIPRKHYK